MINETRYSAVTTRNLQKCAQQEFDLRYKNFIIMVNVILLPETKR